MTTLAAVLDGAVESGIHQLDDLDDAATIAARVESIGWRCFVVDGTAVSDKASFLAAVAAAGEFPEWFGHNWDALADSLSDLSWAPAAGYVWLLEHHDAYAASAEWPLVRDLFEAAAQRWVQACRS